MMGVLGTVRVSLCSLTITMSFSVAEFCQRVAKLSADVKRVKEMMSAGDIDETELQMYKGMVTAINVSGWYCQKGRTLRWM